MTYFQALALGVIQGITEFLPISSDGHLAILGNLLGVKSDHTAGMVFFFVMLHVGTLGAILVFFRKDIARIISALAGRESGGKSWIGNRGEAWRYAVWIVIATIPAGIAGVVLGDVIESAFASLAIAAVCLIVNGAVLFAAGRAPQGSKEAQSLKWWQAVLIGAAQATALLPGVSRSGTTISSGVALGLNRDAAARFSFLMAIPAIGGATVLELVKVIGEPVQWGPVIAGTLLSFAVGIFALKLLVGILRRGRLALFAYYCWAAGAATLVYALVK